MKISGPKAVEIIQVKRVQKSSVPGKSNFAEVKDALSQEVKGIDGIERVLTNGGKIESKTLLPITKFKLGNFTYVRSFSQK